MELFLLDKIFLKILGITPNQHTFSKMKMLIVMSFFYIASILSGVFFFTEAKSVRDYTDSIYATISIINVCISFTNMIFQTDKLFQFIDNVEKGHEYSK